MFSNLSIHLNIGDDPLTTPFMDPITSFEATFNSGNQLINVQSKLLPFFFPNKISLFFFAFFVCFKLL